MNTTYGVYNSKANILPDRTKSTWTSLSDRSQYYSMVEAVAKEWKTTFCKSGSLSEISTRKVNNIDGLVIDRGVSHILMIINAYLFPDRYRQKEKVYTRHAPIETRPPRRLLKKILGWLV